MKSSLKSNVWEITNPSSSTNITSAVSHPTENLDSCFSTWDAHETRESSFHQVSSEKNNIMDFLLKDIKQFDEDISDTYLHQNQIITNSDKNSEIQNERKCATIMDNKSNNFHTPFLTEYFEHSKTDHLYCRTDEEELDCMVLKVLPLDRGKNHKRNHILEEARNIAFRSNVSMISSGLTSSNNTIDFQYDMQAKEIKQEKIDEFRDFCHATETLNLPVCAKETTNDLKEPPTNSTDMNSSSVRKVSDVNKQIIQNSNSESTNLGSEIRWDGKSRATPSSIVSNASKEFNSTSIVSADIFKNSANSSFRNSGWNTELISSNENSERIQTPNNITENIIISNRFGSYSSQLNINGKRSGVSNAASEHEAKKKFGLSYNSDHFIPKCLKSQSATPINNEDLFHVDVDVKFNKQGTENEAGEQKNKFYNSKENAQNNSEVNIYNNFKLLTTDLSNKCESLQQEKIPSILFDQKNIDPDSNVMLSKKDTEDVQKFNTNLWDILFSDHNYFATQAECPDRDVSAGKNDESIPEADQSINCSSLSFDQNFFDVHGDKNSSMQSSQCITTVSAEISSQKSADDKEISCDNTNVSTLDREGGKQTANVNQEDCLPEVKQTEFALDNFESGASGSRTTSVLVSPESPLFLGIFKMNFDQTSTVTNDKTSKSSFPFQSVTYSENQAKHLSAQNVIISNESKDNTNDMNNVYETFPQLSRNAYDLQSLNNYSYDTLYQAKIADTKPSLEKNDPVLQNTTNSNNNEQNETFISCKNGNSYLCSKNCLSIDASMLIPSTSENNSKQMEVARNDVFQMRNNVNNTNANAISRRPIKDSVLRTPILSLFKKNKSENLAAVSTTENILGPSTNIENRMPEVPDGSSNKAIKNTADENYDRRSDQNLFLQRKGFPDQQKMQENSLVYQSETDCLNAEKTETCNETIPLQLFSSFSTNKTFANETEEYITPTQCPQESCRSPEKKVSNKNQLPNKTNASECYNLFSTNELQEIITLSSSSSTSNSPADIFSNSYKTNNESRNSYNSLIDNFEKTSHENLNSLRDYSQVYETFYNTNSSSVRAQSVEVENGQLNFQAQNAFENNTTLISHKTEPKNCITYHDSNAHTGSRTIIEMCFSEEFPPAQQKSTEIINSQTEYTETNFRPNFNSSVQNYYSDSNKNPDINNGKEIFENATLNTNSFKNGNEQYLISSNHFENNQANYENLSSSETPNSMFNPGYFQHNNQPFPAKDGRYYHLSHNSFQQKDLQNHIAAYQQQQQNQNALKPNLPSSSDLSSSNSVIENTVVDPSLSKQFTSNMPSPSTKEVASSFSVIYEPISPADIQEQPSLHRNVEECDRRLLHHSSGLLISGLSIAALKKNQNNNPHVIQRNSSTPCHCSNCNPHWFNANMSNVNGVNNNRSRSLTANRMPLNLIKNRNVSVNRRFSYSDARQMPDSFNARFTNGTNASHFHQMNRPAHFNNIRLSAPTGSSCLTLNQSGIQANESSYDRLGNVYIPQTGNSSGNFGSKNQISYRVPDVSRNQFANHHNQIIFPNTNYLDLSNANSASSNAFGATSFKSPYHPSAQSLRNGDKSFNPLNLQATVNEYEPSNNVSQHFKTQMNYSSYPVFPYNRNDIPADNNQFVNYDSVDLYQVNQLSNKLDLLIDQENFEELESILASPELTAVRHINIERAKAYLAFSKGQYKELFHILSQTQFPSKYHSGLQYLWEQGHCLEFQRMKGAPLKPVQRYRLKKRYPLPGTICAGSKGTSLREKARVIFSEVYLRDQHPSAEKRKMLAYHTGLTAEQVNTWFKNRRQRDRKRLKELQAESIGNPIMTNETFSGGSIPVTRDY